MADERSGQSSADAANGDGQGELDATDQAALDAATQMPNSGTLLGGLAEVASDMQRIGERANTKAELAQSLSSNTRMVVDPDEVDDLAKFFEDEADKLESRSLEVRELANVSPPGTDPVSTGAASKHGQVGAGDDQAYYENYVKLAQVFKSTAESLRSSAKQTRIDDENAADSFNRGAQNA
ncbi:MULTISPECIES: hypothetical protein [Actinopolyspora]|uniref:PE family protein n=1 Tax=Actinopolyspora saharensis TaxID=995062 RepID=A0A1H0ZVA9_9ACTN|nr:MULTISPECIES: hypothetical protein [Actinopolyspora]NHD15561.1 hypothetical protein [Actinopolyspora sp. BKK2]NHE75225.1 hypothetical protein [Actinopolyspora sp. BKK1]SDQ31343.1 hypothetical protein SAMN04489718_1260 [Actinopolyspora saharensis]